MQTHYRIEQTLKYQAAKLGCVVVGVTEELHGSKCGHIHTKLGGNKRIECPSCGHEEGVTSMALDDVLLKALRDTDPSGMATLPDRAIHRKFRQLPDFSGLNVSDK